MIIAILAILKCGAAYVPIAPELPTERKKFMCQAANTKLVLTDSHNLGKVSEDLQYIDISKSISATYPILSPSVRCTAASTAYVIFTSGSTGEPKGVSVPHASLVNLLEWQAKNSISGPGINTVQFTKLSFDVSFQEIFSTLVTGGSLYLISDELTKDPNGLLDFIQDNQIHRIFQPFISFQAIANTAVLKDNYPTSLKEIFTAGEQLVITPKIREFFKALPTTTLFNQYGPTEAAVIVTQLVLPASEVDGWPNLPSIGFPIANTQMILLDEHDRILESGQEGELCISGPCLANGYLNREELTAEKFTWVTFPDNKRRRIYKTGDIAKITKEGEIMFLGRKDDQVKIRGHRIELGEIEVSLSNIEGILQAVVLAKSYEDGQKYLAAYYQAPEHSYTSQELNKKLSSSLPEYMVPSVYIPMLDFPRNTNGKVDKKRLPSPINKRENIEAVLIPPVSSEEKEICGVFQKLLNYDVIGLKDNFFEFGGNSLLAQKLSNDLLLLLNIEVPVTKIYQYPTPQKLAGYIATDPKEPSSKASFQKNPTNAIAIIGMTGRFPGAEDTVEFWNNLVSEKETITFFDKEDLDPSIPPSLSEDANYIKARGVLANADQFDPAFFGINPKHAALMDPQQRLFLELSWELLEKSYLKQDEKGYKIGVFAGTNTNTYFQKNILPNRDLIEESGEFQVMTLNEKDYISTRTAYHFDLKGPAVSVYSACSTSLLAVAQAVQSIRSGQCEMAIAGGASVTSPINSGSLYQEGAIFSKDGHCRPFDANGSGTLFSDGAGAIMLKDLDKAIEDGDNIYATIKGIGINNDGGDKGSFSAPSAHGQADVILSAMQDGNVTPESISYIEAHGTATPLGDPIETEGLKLAFQQAKNTGFTCGIGSVKSNFGHITAAAGIAGLIKTALSIHHQKLPATLGFQKLNPHIDFGSTPFYIVDKTTDWKAKFPRRAGISSFGIGGTNVHVILEEYQTTKKESTPSSAPYHLIALQAKSEGSIIKYREKLKNFISSNGPINLDDLTYSIHSKPSDFPKKNHLVFKDQEDLLAQLSEKEVGKLKINTVKNLPQSPLFLFPGQGSQYLNMGKDLLESAPVFREALEHCASLFDAHLDRELLDIIYPAQVTEEAESLLKNTKYTQPAIFAIEYALAKQWMSWGISPVALTGHSIGEFVAAHLAGIFTLEEVTRIVAVRGKLVADLPNGDMLSVRAPQEKVAPLMTEGLSLAAVNSPQLCVVAGPSSNIDEFGKTLQKHGLLHKKLFTSHAFHSSMMDPILGAFKEEIKKCSLQAPQLPIYSTVTSQRLTETEATSAEYWTEHLRKTVLFSPTIETLMDIWPTGILLEIGPGNVLSSLVKQHPSSKKATVINSLNRQSDSHEYSTLLHSMGEILDQGLHVDWGKFYYGQKRIRLDVPTYAFDRKTCWIAPPPQQKDQRTIMAATSLPTPSTPIPKESPTVMRTALISQKIKKVMEEVSGMDFSDQPDDATFLEMGLDSLLLTQLSFNLKREFGMPVSFRELSSRFNSIVSLTDHLDQHLPPDQFQPETPPVHSPSLDTNTAPPTPTNTATPAPTEGHVYSQQQQATIGLIGKQLELLSQQIALLQGTAAQANTAPATAASALPHYSAPKEIPEKAVPAKALLNEDIQKTSKPFGAAAKIDRKGQALGEKQLSFISEFTQRYTSKTKSSKEYTQKNRPHMADPRVVNGFNPVIKEIVYSLVVNRSKGSRLWDIDGNEYLDVLNGFGSVLFGHGPSFINTAIQDQLTKGYEIGPQHELSGEVCKLVCDITGHERSALCNTGSEAVMGALRIARTITQRSLIVAFNGSYHGIFDEVIVRGTKSLKSIPASAGIMPEAVENILVLDYGTEESLRVIEERKAEIAAVLVEPVQSRRPEFQPVEFLRKVREITASSGSALIFDEVITGFRMHPRGAQELFGIKADLATYGKVIGGGLPIGVIAGSSRFMNALDGGQWQYGDDSIPEVGVTYFAGTFVRHPLALAAAKATLEHIQNDAGKLQLALGNKVQRLANELDSFFESNGLPAYIGHFGSMWKIKWKEELPFTELLFGTFREMGLHIYDGFPCFATEAYVDADIDNIVHVIKKGFCNMAKAEFWDDMVPGLSQRFSINIENSIPPLPGAKLGKTPEGTAAWFVPDPKRPGKYLQLAPKNF
ncbi:polyketide synthase [Echinicola strongylocentroti]|uniref:polyketide synthase n=1 Tax=Echinicola strongylocentroti TaxID=1795355 RepID=UPI001FE28C21|nr:polyketide synthase [Echinicola strongylocentroti]